MPAPAQPDDADVPPGAQAPAVAGSETVVLARAAERVDGATQVPALEPDPGCEGRATDETALAPGDAAERTARVPGPDDAAGRPARGPRPPARVGPYKVLGELGRGGAGVVYVARSEALDRLVAVKVLRAEPGEREELRERFQIEARAAARLRHPHIVGIHDVGEDEAGRPFLVMELVDGRSLAVRLRDDGPLAAREAARVAERLARALAYAHARWILHRDLKPHNVLIAADGQPLLTDFGLAKLLEEGAPTPTVSGQVMGTPAYMPPEQARGDVVDGRSDVYALGATLYEALTGAPPWDGPTALAILARVTGPDPVRPPSARRRGLDRDLETICLRCLEKDPADRYPSAEALAQDLARYLADEPIAARPPGPLERARKWLRRNRAAARALAAAGVAVAALAAGGGGAFLVRLRAERDERALEARRAHLAATEARLALDALVHEVRDELGELPGEGLRAARARLLARASAQLARLERLAPAAAGPLERAEVQRQVGDLALLAGDVARALDAADLAVALAVEAVHAEASARGPGSPGRSAPSGAGDEAPTPGARPAGGRGAGAAVGQPLGVVDRGALASARGRDAAWALVACLGLRAEALGRSGRSADALRDLEAGRSLVRALRGGAPGERADDLRAATLLARLGEGRRAQGDAAAAVAALAEALAVLGPPGRGGWRADGAPDDVAERSLVLSELGRALLGLGAAEAARAALTWAAALDAAHLAARPASWPRRRAVVTGLVDLADVALALGRTDEAERALDGAAAHAAALVGADPDGHDARRVASIVAERRTQALLALGRPREALAALEDALAVRRWLAAREASHAALGDLSSALDAVGACFEDLGEPARARAALEEAAALDRARADADPADARARHALLLGLERLARLRQACGDAVGAEEAVAEGLARAAPAAEGRPTRDERLGQALLLARRAEAALADGRLEAAAAAAADSLAVRRAALAEAPELTEVRLAVAAGLLLRADVAVAQGDAAAARAAVDEAVALLEARARAGAPAPPTGAPAGAPVDPDPGSPAADALAAAVRRRADLARADGDLAAARADYARAVALRGDPRAGPARGQRLGAGPGTARARREALVALSGLADVLRDAGDAAGARARFEEVLALQRARAAGEAPAGARHDLAVALLRAGDARRDAGEPAAAAEAWCEAADVLVALAQAAPDDARARREAVNQAHRAVDLRRKAGQLDQAAALAAATLDLAGRSAAEAPDDPRAVRDLSLSHLRQADVLHAQGRVDEAVAALARAVELHRRLVALAPRYAPELERLEALLAAQRR